MLKPWANRMVGALLDVADDFLVQIFLGQVGREERDQVGVLHRLGRLGDFQAVLLRLGEAGAGLAYADHDVITAVLQVQRMRAALAAVAEDGDTGLLQGLLVDVLLRVDLHHCAVSEFALVSVC